MFIINVYYKQARLEVAVSPLKQESRTAVRTREEPSRAHRQGRADALGQLKSSY